MPAGLDGAEATALLGRCHLHYVKKMAALVAGMLLGAVMTGCGSAEPDADLIPVSGKVKMDGKLVTTGGSVSYRDATGMIQPTGEIKSDGTYTLIHNRQEGAPIGEYRVVVFAWEPKEATARHGGLPRLIVDPKYTNPSTTPLRVEVKQGATPGHYDLTVTSK